MAIIYQVRKQKFVTSKGKQTKYIARAMSNGETTIEHLQRLISKISAISEGDVRSVLITLTQLVASELAAGRRVSLGDLGRMRIGLRSRAMDRAEEFTVQDIRKARVSFLPGALIRDELQVASYQRYTPSETKPGAPVPPKAGDTNGSNGTDSSSGSTDGHVGI